MATQSNSKTTVQIINDKNDMGLSIFFILGWYIITFLATYFFNIFLWVQHKVNI